MGRALWLAEALRDWGLTVVELDGWRTRGSDSFDMRGVIAHHTAGASTGDIPSLRVLRDGRSDLPGPLAHIGLGRSGTCYLVASGKCNHAGRGNWRGVTSGNVLLGSIEAENDGRQGWPEVQIESYVTLCAAMCDGGGFDADMVCGHKEYALPAGRKPDPHGIDMTAFRTRVQATIDNGGGDMPLTQADLDAIGLRVKAEFVALTENDLVLQRWHKELLLKLDAILGEVGGGGGSGGVSPIRLARATRLASETFSADLNKAT